MFGQPKDQPQNDTIPNHSIDGVLSDTQPAAPAPSNDNGGQDWQHPGAPITNDDSSNSSAPVIDAVQPQVPPAPPSDAPAAPAPDSDDLIAIKQRALSELSPLVGHLEQSPEEKFRTTMMMIQASDDHSLVKAAYEAAHQISDEKARAQALLDIVNEINYFTQPHEH